MKLKYRMMILFIVLFTMGMGMITFSVGVEDEKSTNVLSDEDIQSAKTAKLVKNDNEEINKLIKNYINAKFDGDADKLALYVSDKESISKDELDVPTTYMEGYETIDCYVIDMPIEDNYVVYVYKEYKMKGIETVIPSVVRHYVCSNDKDNLVVYSGEVEASIVEYIEATGENEEVKKLINMVNNKIEQIKNEDAVAKAFLDKLDDVVNEDGSTESENDGKESAKPEETKKPEDTAKLDSSKEPAASKKPESTKKPDASKQPNATKAA